MNEALKTQIRERMQAKDTQELVDIWKTRDRQEWSNEAFEVIREILVERTGTLPEYHNPNSSTAEQHDEDSYYNFTRLNDIASWASALSWFFLGLGVLIAITTAVDAFRYLTRFYGVPDTFSNLLPQIFLAFVSVFFFVLSQAIAQGIYLLMDIEDNTRSGTRQE